ncbi:NUDIX hydrolase [Clostridium neuense]|uniref:NUDIX hydrolase n=1 Tax=Clostridium neuense TaxID=1728934 RepID=A0ABW8TGD4_9CLOT
MWNLPGGGLEKGETIKYFSLNELPVNTVPRHIDRIKDF